MMNTLARFTLTIAALLAASPLSQATNVELTGTWNYSINASRSYKSYAPAQSGEKSSLGSGYYRYGYIRGGDIENNSLYTRSGALSLNFWRLNYYGGSTGHLLFTRSYSALSAGYYYPNAYKSGYFYSPSRYGYASIVVDEYKYQYFKWYETDDVNFSNYQYF